MRSFILRLLGRSHTNERGQVIFIAAAFIAGLALTGRLKPEAPT